MSDIDFKKLAEPFPIEDVEFRAGATNKEKTKALALAYITSRAVMNRLDEVCGPENWRDEYAAGPDKGVICGISLRVNGEWITKWDGAENSNIEAVKGGLSDAFKRAAIKWGIGRYLYNLDGAWVECETRGNTVVIPDKNKPKLPAWALPSKANGNGKAPTTTKQEQPAVVKTVVGHVSQEAWDEHTKALADEADQSKGGRVDEQPATDKPLVSNDFWKVATPLIQAGKITAKAVTDIEKQHKPDFGAAIAALKAATV